jgi:hypothetical protein
MKATELRIGNWVYSDGQEKQVVGLIGNQIMVAKTVNGVKNDNDVKDPIPLTEEILLKCAMLKYEGWDGQEYWYAVDDEQDPNRFELFETAQGYELPSGYIVDSLHVLQNAYCFHYAGIRELNVEL